MQDEFDVPWTGYYVQNGAQNEMTFDNMWISMSGGISGSGSDGVGSFTLNGQISPNGFFQFIKQYDGAHAVRYQGNISPGCLSGRWSLDNLGDDFYLSLDTEQWKGSFTLDGRTYPMQTNIYVSERGVFGLGKDSEGVFTITGVYNPTNNRLNFVKSYLGRYHITYDGQMFDDGQFLVVKGEWDLSTGQSGEFEMYQRIEGRFVQCQQFYQPPPPPQGFLPTFYGMPPQMMPPQYSAGMAGGGALTGYLDDLDLHGGESDDVRQIMDKISRGKRIKGSQLQTFLPMIRREDDMQSFLQSLRKDKVEDFTMDHLVEGLSGAKNQDYNVKAIVFLYPLLSKTPGALENSQLEKLFVFSKDKREVEKALNIDL